MPRVEHIAVLIGGGVRVLADDGRGLGGREGHDDGESSALQDPHREVEADEVDTGGARGNWVSARRPGTSTTPQRTFSKEVEKDAYSVQRRRSADQSRSDRLRGSSTVPVESFSGVLVDPEVTLLGPYLCLRIHRLSTTSDNRLSNPPRSPLVEPGAAYRPLHAIRRVDIAK